MTRQLSLIKLGTSHLFQHVQLPALLLILTFTVNGAAVLLTYGEVLCCLFVWVFFYQLRPSADEKVHVTYQNHLINQNQ